MKEQEENISRVSQKIAYAILEFWEYTGPKTPFHMENLLKYVRTRLPKIAPDSPSRVMRDLRQHKVINYVVLNRRKSLYKFI